MKKGTLTLLGSGEFTPLMIEVDKFLLGAIDSPKIAVLSLAAGKENTFYKWIKKGEEYYKKMGFIVKGFHIKDGEDCNFKAYAKELMEYNYFVFSGGDPEYLLNSLSGSLVWDVIGKRYQEGATIVGASAGAMVMGKKVWSKVYEFDKKGVILPWENGLGLVDFGILPHFNVFPKYFTKEQLMLIRENLPNGLKVVGIDEDTAYINIDGNWLIMGSSKVTNDVKKYYS